jgi:hypothetical protein
MAPGIEDQGLQLGRDGRGPQGQLLAGTELAATEARMPGAAVLAAALFAGVPTLLRSGEPVTVMDGDETQRAEAYRGAVSGLAGLFQQAAVAFAEGLGPVSGGVLDVGCGSGVWSLAVAGQNPAVSVTGLDLPGVTEVFLHHAAELGMAGRVHAWSAETQRA